jgi:hypothetical protein
VTVAYALVAFLLSVVAALVATLLGVKDRHGATTIVRSAALAFAGSMAVCIPAFTAVRLL